MDHVFIYVCILLASVLVAFVLGYVAGRLDFIAARLGVPHPAVHPVGTPQWNAAKRNKTSPAPETAAKIDIDDTKVVLPVNTTGMQKVGDSELGKTTVAADDVNAAASKLAQLKGK